MNKNFMLILLGVMTPIGSALSMSIDIEHKVDGSEILLGKINNELATNHIGDKYIELKWINKSGETISSKPYLIPKESMDGVRFCASTETESKCSSSWSSRNMLRSSVSPQFMAGNTANLTVRVLDNDSLKHDEPATSISDFDIISGNFGFHYTEQLDQNGHVLKNIISYSQQPIYLTLPTIESNTESIKACSVGGFFLNEATYIESCTPSYEIDVSPVPPEPEESVLCLYQAPNYKGNEKCFDEEEINHSKEMSSPEFPHLMANYGLVDSSSLTIKPGYRATVGNFSGHNSKANGTWNNSASYLGDDVGDRGKHVFIERDDTYGCFFEHHALHSGAFERAVSQCVEIGEKIEELTTLKSGLQRTLSTITMHPGLEITLYSDLSGNNKLGTYNQARFWTGSPYPNDRAKSFSISVDKNYSFFQVNGNTLLRSLENSSLALKNLIAEKGDLHLVTSDGHWTRNFVLPEGVPEYTRLKFERKSTWSFNVVNGETTYQPNRGETLVVTYINNQWVLSGDIGKEIKWSVEDLKYDYDSGRVEFSYNSNYSNINDFYIRLTKNGKYAASCEGETCYYTWSSVKKGIKRVHRYLDLNVGDRLNATIYDADRNILASNEKVVVPDWSISNLWYDKNNFPHVSFDNNYSNQKGFYIRLTVNDGYVASCVKETCYYYYSYISNNSKTVFGKLNMKKGDILKASIHYGSSKGIVVDQRTIVVK